MNLQRICWRHSLWQLPPSSRRSLYQSTSRAAAAPALAQNDHAQTVRRGGVYEVPILWNSNVYEYAKEKGIHDRTDTSKGGKRLFSARGFNVAYTAYQDKILSGLNARIAERGYEGQVKDIAIMTARDPAQAAVFNHASMAFNNHFFFSGLHMDATSSPSPEMRKALEDSFGSMDNLRDDMLTMADAMFGPGFVWLLRVHAKGTTTTTNQYKLLATYLAGSPFAGAHNRRQPLDMNAQNVSAAVRAGGLEGLSKGYLGDQHMRVQNEVGYVGPYAAPLSGTSYGGVGVTPLLCVSTWEHTYMYDYNFNKRMFLDRWWNFVNWETVQVNAGVAAGAQKGKYERGQQTTYI